ncbi:hypothetical protein NMG60_11013942 [Bertholletia excelsa]
MAYDPTDTKHGGVCRKIRGAFRHVSSSKPASAVPSSHLHPPDQKWSTEGEQKVQPSAQRKQKKAVKIVSGADLEGHKRVARLETSDRTFSGYIKQVKTKIGMTTSFGGGGGGGGGDGGGEIGRSQSSVGSVNAKVTGYINRVRGKFRTTSNVGGGRGKHDYQKHV